MWIDAYDAITIPAPALGEQMVFRGLAICAGEGRAGLAGVVPGFQLRQAGEGETGVRSGRPVFFVHHGVGSEAWSADGFTPLPLA